MPTKTIDMNTYALPLRLLLLCIFLALFSVNSHSAALKAPKSASAILNMRIRILAKLNYFQFAQLTGRKMNFKERVSFIILKKQIRKDVRKGINPTIAEYALQPRWKPTKWWHWVIVIGLAIILVMAIVSVSKLG